VAAGGVCHQDVAQHAPGRRRSRPNRPLAAPAGRSPPPRFAQRCPVHLGQQGGRQDQQVAVHVRRHSHPRPAVDRHLDRRQRAEVVDDRAHVGSDVCGVLPGTRLVSWDSPTAMTGGSTSCIETVMVVVRRVCRPCRYRPAQTRGFGAGCTGTLVSVKAPVVTSAVVWTKRAVHADGCTAPSAVPVSVIAFNGDVVAGAELGVFERRVEGTIAWRWCDRS